MYVFDALRQPSGQAAPGEESEFRLLCSGTLYRGAVQTYDWTKSDVCRVLLRGRVILFVTSRPLDSYPQELMLRMSVQSVKEEYGRSGTGSRSAKSFTPHAEVAADMAALLTLLLRRLVVVHSQVRVFPPKEVLEGYGLPDWPWPLAPRDIVKVWRRRPFGILTNPDGSTEIEDHGPAPVAVDSEWLERVLGALPSLAESNAILACARLYAQGMQLIEERPDISYQLFISAAETLAGVALAGFSPTDDEKVKAKPLIFARAKKLGLRAIDARDLAVLATEGMGWHIKKFVRCLHEFTDDRIWTKDDLFLAPAPFLPTKQTFTKALKAIYSARGAALHAGEAYSESVSIGTSPNIPVGAFLASLAGEDMLPPVTWFERVVQRAIIVYVESKVPAPPAQERSGE
jgi:hypothetical protein